MKYLFAFILFAVLAPAFAAQTLSAADILLDKKCDDEISAVAADARNTTQGTRIPIHMMAKYQNHLKSAFKLKKVGSCK